MRRGFPLAGMIGGFGILLAVAASGEIGAAGRPAPEPAKPPETPAQRITGRWTLTLDDLPFEHRQIQASFTVEGDLLTGTLAVGRDSVRLTAGRAVGTGISFAFRHVDGEVYRMQGTLGAKGLEGVWEAGNERGRWRASRRSSR